MSNEPMVCENCMKGTIRSSNGWYPINNNWCFNCNDEAYIKKYGYDKYVDALAKAIKEGKTIIIARRLDKV